MLHVQGLALGRDRAEAVAGLGTRAVAGRRVIALRGAALRICSRAPARGSLPARAGVAQSADET